MKTLTTIIAVSIALCLMAATPAPKYSQPTDDSIREIIVTKVADGDTVTADVYMGALGGTEIVMRGVRLRLKDVSCYEVTSQDPQEREVALREQEALSKLIYGAKRVTAKLYRHGTFDRHDAEIFTDTVSCNEVMRTYPQGGRGIK